MIQPDRYAGFAATLAKSDRDMAQLIEVFLEVYEDLEATITEQLKDPALSAEGRAVIGEQLRCNQAQVARLKALFHH